MLFVVPVGIILLLEDKVGQYLPKHLLFEQLSCFQVLLAHVRVSSFPGLQVGSEITISFHQVMVVLALIQNRFQGTFVLICFLQLDNVIFFEFAQLTFDIILRAMLFDQPLRNSLDHRTIFIAKSFNIDNHLAPRIFHLLQLGELGTGYKGFYLHVYLSDVSSCSHFERCK